MALEGAEIGVGDEVGVGVGVTNGMFVGVAVAVADGITIGVGVDVGLVGAGGSTRLQLGNALRPSLVSARACRD